MIRFATLPKGLHIAVSVLLCAACSGPSAQTHIRSMVPFAPGGPSDSGGRIVAQRYTEMFPAENVVVENRPGANGVLAARALVQAPADGKTWMFADGALISVNPSLYPRDPDFDADRDLKVVAAIGLQPSLLVVNPAGPKTLGEFVELAKRRPVTYASAGIGSTGHLTMAYFGSVAGLQLTHVPYKGAVPGLTDLVGGQVESAFNLVAGPLALVRAGKVRALAVSGNRPLPELPGVPTVRESGYPEFEVLSGLFVVVSSRTPPEVVKGIEENLERVVDDARVHERLRALAVEPARMSAAQATRWLSAEKARWTKVIRESGIKAQN